jgi:hypothetical protein
MRTITVVAISLVGVIALLDVAASFVINGSVDIPFLLILVVALALVVQLTGNARDVRRDVATLLGSYTLRPLHDIPQFSGLDTHLPKPLGIIRWTLVLQVTNR